MSPGLDRLGPRRAVALAWGSFGATVLLLCVQGFYVLASGTPLLDTAKFGLNSFPLISLGVLLGAFVGALVASRHPSNPVGWLFCAGSLGSGVGLAAEGYSTAVELHGFAGVEALNEPSVVLNYVFGAPWTLTLLAATLLVFPDGRLPSRRWRPVLWALTVPVGVSTVVLVAFATTHTLVADQKSSDVSTLFVVVPLTAAWLVLAVAMVASVVCLVRRLRRSTGVLHQQLRWLATAGAAVAACLMLSLFAPDPTPSKPWAWLLLVPLFVAFAAFQVSAGVAVLRYRLYDIELVISRAVVLALLLVFVTAGYVALVVTIGGILGDRTDSRFWPSVLATAVVALAFQPLRRRVVRLAHRAAYGARAVPYEALQDLARRLGGSPDPATLLPTVAEASGAAVGAAAVTVRLRVPEADDEVATWPAGAPRLDGDATAEVHVVEHGEVLGSIAVRTRREHDLREGDRRLLADLAEQSALAFRNARLTAELHARVADLDRRTAELAASRRRLIDARDAERERLERAIRRNVVTHLEPMPAQLEALRDQLAGGAEPARVDLAPLVEATGTALDELRALTRGVFPAQLARAGLGPALGTHLSRAGAGSLGVAAAAQGRRFAPRVEAAVYFCAVEGLALVPGPAEVLLEVSATALELRVTGATGGRPLDDADEVALQPLRDRIESVGGELRWADGGGRTALVVTAPLEAEEAEEAVAASPLTAPRARTPTPPSAVPARTPTS